MSNIRTLPSRYKPTGTSASGGLSEVIFCENTHLERKVAIKTIPNPFEQGRLQDEITALLSMRSKHVVQVFDLIKYSSNTFGIVLEFIDGKDLLESNFPRQSTENLLKTLWQIASGIADIHQAGIIHRDIKPNNMKLDGEGILKIFDFGLARNTDNDAATIGFKGTPGAFDETLKREVALKTPKIFSAEKRFHRSAIVSAKVNHPNVAKTLDYFEDQGRIYLVEEFIQELDLQNAILSKVSFLDPFLASKLLHHLAKGLAASHHAGVIHRDLKPTNIMVTEGIQLKSIKITDFGIAKMADEEIAEAVARKENTLSTSQTAMGALPYMAPEAITTPREVSVKADIWSLGAMMYELLSGEKPFGAGLKAVHSIIEAKTPPFPSFITSNPQFKKLSSQLTEIVYKCLQKNPEDRPTADELVTLCGTLCYPVYQRHFGQVREIRYSSWGFISLDGEDSKDVFFHLQSVYGKKPVIGNKVMFSQFEGEGANRAHPVVCMS